MPTYCAANVVSLIAARPGLQRIDTTEGRAYVLTALTGPVSVGDSVVLNTTAVTLGLGTGGWHIVHWNLTTPAWSVPGGGHIVKLRYTSLQADTGAAEEEHPDLPADLGGAPVVACTVHSQVACVAAAVKDRHARARVVYVMTDGGALPVAISDLVHACREAGVIDLVVSAGHAFGGDLEAVAVPSALLLARHVGAADVIVVGMGPGVVGTGSGLGTTAIEAAGVLSATAALGGAPLLCVRASSGDHRPRHQGVSHHTDTVLGLAPTEAVVPVPEGLDIDDDGRHRIERVPVPDMAGVLARLGLVVTTMGRGPSDDPLFFAAAAAAGIAAASRVRGR